MPASDYQYWLGKETKDLKYVGKRGIVRRDADDKATGKAVFARDMNIPGMLYARALASPYAHAKIKSMDTSAAEKLPGVRAVLRYDDSDVTTRTFFCWEPDVINAVEMWPPFTSQGQFLSAPGGEAFMEGQPVGVVIAADELDIADEALELVKITWEELPFVIDIKKALEPGAPMVYENLKEWNPSGLFPPIRVSGSTVSSEQAAAYTYGPGWKGTANANNIKNVTKFTLPGSNMEKGFAEADQTIQFSFNRTESSGFSPETLSTVVQWTDNGTVEVWQGGEQMPPIPLYAFILGIPKSRILFHRPYAGGQFGGWDSQIYPQSGQVPSAALLSKRTNRPVKLVGTRRDDRFQEMDCGIYNVKVGFKKDGTITAAQVETTIAQCNDIGIIPDTHGTGHLVEATKIPNIQSTGTCVFQNKCGAGPSRCEQQANAHVFHQIYTRIASALGVDEGIIALKNDGSHGHDMAWLSQNKKQNKMPDIDSLSVVLKVAKDAVGFDQKFHAPGARKLANGKYHGMATAPAQEFSNGVGPNPIMPFVPNFTCGLSVDNGAIFLSAFRPDCGLDGRTGFARVIAEETGMRLEDVIYARAQEATAHKPPYRLGGGGGSAVFNMNSWVVAATSRLLKRQMLAVAASMLGAKPEDLDIVESNIIFKSNPSKATPVAAMAGLQGISVSCRDTDYVALGIPPMASHGYYTSRCVNIVEVEVDPETGQVDVTNAVCANDVGQPISPETVEGQMYGAAIMGYSTGGIEETIYDSATGVMLNPNMLDYKIMTILDAPTVDYRMVTSRMGNGVYGACGVGEDNTTFGSTLIVNAVYNALGIWVDTYPPTPERVLKALGKG